MKTPWYLFVWPFLAAWDSVKLHDSFGAILGLIAGLSALALVAMEHLDRVKR